MLKLQMLRTGLPYNVVQIRLQLGRARLRNAHCSRNFLNCGGDFIAPCHCQQLSMILLTRNLIVRRSSCHIMRMMRMVNVVLMFLL